MTLSDATLLINSNKISNDEGQQWADLGCGNGLFSKALINILPKNSTIYAIDQKSVSISDPRIHFNQLNFEKESLPGPLLDGIMMINSLHYIKEKPSLLTRLRRKLLPEGVFIIAEYEMTGSNPWVPYPVPFLTASGLFKDAGFDSIEKIHELPSVLNNTMIYSAFIYNSKPL
ncbi:MAG: class I SAM-dependent methyltransferase [Bacteroidota bacterium]